ncbi:MAG TPA: hypothetical protein VHR47_12755 [Bacillota bacterium]|nr:hypothetical protein [Bacillota bacterium]
MGSTRRETANFPVPEPGFTKITPVNGFDANDRNNAMQNNYAWSMSEKGDYIYVGTARNIAYSVLSNQVLGNIPVPPILTPPGEIRNAGEIWRYKKDGSEGWQRVYQAPPEPMNIGFRYMINYKDALYAGALTPLSPNLLILKSDDGVNWRVLPSAIQGFSTRYMVEHDGLLFLSALPLTGVAQARLYVSSDPEGEGWQLVDLTGDPAKNPHSNIDVLLSFNGHLYAGAALPTGFELWRTRGRLPQKDDWILVVDQGAGDARNEHPWSIGVFQDWIYLGSAIEVAIRSINPDDPIVPPKGFDLIRVNRDDQWELVVGGPPVVPTQPTTGVRGKPLSGYSSGFDDLTNGYCWQIQAFGDELFLGTWSWNDLIPAFISVLPQVILRFLPEETPDWIRSLIEATEPFFANVITPVLYALGQLGLGFDLWRTKDGVHWTPLSLNGLGNVFNYGLRMLFVSTEPKLYVGTANPFQGCEVWRNRRDCR